MTEEEWGEYRGRNEIVSREEQYDRGLLPERRQRNFVSMPQAQQPVRFDPHETRLDVVHPTTQHVELRTSAVDRAQGFQWMITPISIVVAVLAVLVSVAFENDFLSFWSLLIFWLTFCVVYVAGWVLTVLITPEFISLFSTWQQWGVIKAEQRERWAHYKWQTGRTVETRLPRSASQFTVSVSSVEVPGWALFVGGLVGVVVAALYLVGGGLTMNALKIVGRKFDTRAASPREFVRQRMASSADSLNRAGRDAARVEVVNEAICRLTELAYVLDAGELVNVDPVTGRLLIPAPWGAHGWKHYGLRRWEGRTLRAILWDRQATFKPGRVRPPLFVYDPDTRGWHLNMGDYSSLDAAGWYLRRAPVTVDEWRQYAGRYAQTA